MDTDLRILVLVRAGHFQDGLVAVLKTLPRVDLFLNCGVHVQSWEEISRFQPTFALIDLDALNEDDLGALKKRWPSIRCVGFTDHCHTRPPQFLGVDVVLPHGISAGDLLESFLQLRTSGYPSKRSSHLVTVPATT